MIPTDSEARGAAVKVGAAELLPKPVIPRAQPAKQGIGSVPPSPSRPGTGCSQGRHAVWCVVTFPPCGSQCSIAGKHCSWSRARQGCGGLSQRSLAAAAPSPAITSERTTSTAQHDHPALARTGATSTATNGPQHLGTPSDTGSSDVPCPGCWCCCLVPMAGHTTNFCMVNSQQPTILFSSEPYTVSFVCVECF